MSETLDDELKSRLARYLDSLEGAARAGGDAVASQGPEVVRELVAYTLATSALEAACAACLMALSAYAVATVWANRGEIEEASQSDGVLTFFACMLLSAGGIAGFFWLCSSIGTALKCYFAPRLFVLEYVAGLVRGGH